MGRGEIKSGNPYNNGGAGSSRGTLSGSRYNPETDVYTGVYLSPCRDGTNLTMFTWNSANMGTNFDEVVNVWRIITSKHPDNLEMNTSWIIGDNPKNIISGLENDCSTKNITNYATDGNLYYDWIDADTYEGCYIIYLVEYKLSDNPNASRAAFRYLYSTITNYCISDHPPLSYDAESGELVIGTATTGRRILEFRRTDRRYGYPTSISDEETLNEMLFTSVMNMERSNNFDRYKAYYSLDKTLGRWKAGAYTVGVRFEDTLHKSTISNAIDTALRQINSVLNTYGVYFTRGGTSGDITITVDTEYNLYGIDLETADYVYGGRWETSTDSNGYITSAAISIATDVFDYVPFCTHKTAILEELAQSMGAGYDQTEYPLDTLHTDFNYRNKSSTLSAKDENILRLVYSDSVAPNYTPLRVSKGLNIPKGVYQPSTSNADTQMRIHVSDFMDSNAEYEVRVFIIKSNGKFSETSDWITVSTPERIRPNPFNWNPDTVDENGNKTGEDFNLKAEEWNRLMNNINDVRIYRGKSEITFEIVEPNDDFMAYMYNDAVDAIQSIGSTGECGAYLTKVQPNDDITTKILNDLRSELNVIS